MLTAERRSGRYFEGEELARGYQAVSIPFGTTTRDGGQRRAEFDCVIGDGRVCSAPGDAAVTWQTVRSRLLR